MTGAPPPTRLGVGFLGAGPVTQAIHLPTLARLTDLFRVEHVMDVDPAVAGQVAEGLAARSTTEIEELLGDPSVDVVAVCSPHPFHAAQVVAACRAGKKAVLCEKPFATTPEEAEQIAAVAAETGVPILVGAMHVHDAGWTTALGHSAIAPLSIRSSIVLPPNHRFEDFATEVLTRPSSPPPPDAVAALTGGILGLAVHDLPLIRELLSRHGVDVWRRLEVVHAEPLDPFGYLVLAHAGDVTIELHAVMHAGWQPDWRLTAVDDTEMVEVEFTPSYVHAGSATTTITRGGDKTVHAPADHNGYESEWRQLASVARGAAPRVPLRDLIDDVEFLLDFAEQAAGLTREGVPA